MGMYTEYRDCFTLRADTPKPVINIMQQLVEYYDGDLSNLWAHPFFQSKHASVIFHSGSAYFKTAPFCDFKQHIDGRYFLNSAYNCKYNGGASAQWFEWISPYIDAEAGDNIGHCWYEEEDAPTATLWNPRWDWLKRRQQCAGCNLYVCDVDADALCITCGYECGSWPKHKLNQQGD